MTDADTDTAPEIEERPARPGTVVAAAIICFFEAGFCALVVLAGLVITALGGEAHAAGTASGLLITSGLLIAAVFLVVGVVYVLGARGLLRRSRLWYLIVVVLLALSGVAGLVAFGIQRNLWDLFWPVVDGVALGLLVGFPQSRAYFASSGASAL